MGDLISTEQSGDVLIIRIKQSVLNYDVSSSVRQAMRAHLSTGSHVILDLTEVDFIDSCGVGALVAAHHQKTTCGGQLVIASPTQMVRKILRMMRLDRFLLISASVDQARSIVDTRTE